MTRRIAPLTATMILACCCAAPHASAQQQQPPAVERLPLFRFDDAFDMTKTHGDKASARVENNALRITTEAKKAWPGFELRAPQGKWDLSRYEYISLDIHNVSKHDIDVAVRVDNPGADGRDNCITESTGVQPDQHVTLTIPLKRVARADNDIKLFGLLGYPQGLYPDKAGLDPSEIVAIKPFTPAKEPPAENVFVISNVYAGGRYEEPKWLTMSAAQFFPFVDRYGQFKHKDWPGKIRSDDELQAAKDAETTALADDAGPPQWNRFGGYATGPQLKATGHFRTEKVDGKWWLVDPEGRLFFSTGLTGVGASGAVTPIEDRATWFDALPAPDSAEGKPFYGTSWKTWSGHYAGREPVTFNFSAYNLARKYGKDWQAPYADVVHKRLRSWGINTIANWSDSRIYGMGRTPYTAVLFYSSPKLKDGKGGFPDPFAPEFPKAVLAGAKQFLGKTADDPYCIGYFVDNEMPWGGDTTLAIDTLKSGPKQAAKQEFAGFLQKRYASPADLNAAWGTNYDSWDAFVADTSLGSAKTAPTTPAAIKDMTDFTGHLADAYFRQVNEALKSIAPNKLYLGCRSVGGAVNMIEAALRHCDVVSYNRYAHSVTDMTFPGGLDGPMLIGEFHFAAGDRGLFWNGLVSADDQADRARKYHEFVKSALNNPQMVGVHWFQYGDQAVTGRIDGENGQVGFVDVCDTPYTETITASRKTAEMMYDYRATPTLPTTPIMP